MNTLTGDYGKCTLPTIVEVLTVSMSSTEIILTLATRQVFIYFGLSSMILGVIGNVLNIIIFTTLKTFRETTCAIYLISVSVANILLLLGM
ncbi:hypothetical protein I4U23_005628 [Adineta vaga]|nr:hypothetical protein I4U23_005628 [Adineta vaga]